MANQRFAVFRDQLSYLALFAGANIKSLGVNTNKNVLMF